MEMQNNPYNFDENVTVVSFTLQILRKRYYQIGLHGRATNEEENEKRENLVKVN